MRALRRGERGVELTVVDLHWGLTDEQAELGGAVLTCLREVDECHPHFIGMLGERYGWVPGSTDWKRPSARRNAAAPSVSWPHPGPA